MLRTRDLWGFGKSFKSQIRKVYFWIINVDVAIINHLPFITIFMGGIPTIKNDRVVCDIAIPTLLLEVKRKTKDSRCGLPRVCLIPG